MKRTLLLLSLTLFCIPMFADPPETIVYRGVMLPSNEVPPITTLNASGNVTITINVNRDSTGLITSGTVDFDVDYRGFPAPTTFTGLHIHNNPVGVNGSVVITSGLAAGVNSVTSATGSGNIFRRVVIDGRDANPLNFLRGVVNQPTLYYVNLHTTVFPGGAIRAQLAPVSMVFRTLMGTDQEVPPITTINALGVATTTVRVNRDAAGAIVSGTVDFDVAYQFPTAVTLVGLHIHRAAAGVNGPVVISSGIGSGNNSVLTPGAGGNIYRRADIPSTDAGGLAALNGILTDPGQFYVNMHTTVFTGGVIRGQLSSDTYAFLRTMLPNFEVPPVPLIATEARALLTARVTRDATGAIVSGTVDFNVDHSIGAGPTTFTGLHIHNAAEGINGSVVIDSGIASGANSVTSDTGIGNITRRATIPAGPSNALTALRGVVEFPEKYYVNLHTTNNPGGLVRSQLERTTLVYRVTMKPEDEVPPVAGLNASAATVVTARVFKNDAGKAILGAVDFDASYQFPGALTFTGMHIHNGAAGVNAPVVISSGITGDGTAADDDGAGVLFRRTTLNTPDSLSAVDALALNPSLFYVNLHTTTNPGGAVRAQLANNTYFIPQAGGGGGTSTAITLTNPSNTASASGFVYFLDANGAPQDTIVGQATVPFTIPPSGFATFATNSLATAKAGFAEVISTDPLLVGVSAVLPGLQRLTSSLTSQAAFGFRAAVTRNSATGADAGIAVVNTSSQTVRIVVSLASSITPVRARTTAILEPGQQFTGILSTMFPAVDGFDGVVRISALAPLPVQALAVQVIQLGPQRSDFVTPTLVTKTEAAGDAAAQ